MRPKILFNQDALTRLAGAEHRYFVNDKYTPGLAQQVTPKGAKTFYVVLRVNDKPIRERIGRFPPWTVEQARRQATALPPVEFVFTNALERRAVRPTRWTEVVVKGSGGAFSSHDLRRTSATIRVTHFVLKTVGVQPTAEVRSLPSARRAYHYGAHHD